MKVRAILVALLFLASAIIVIFDCGQVGNAQTSLLDDTPPPMPLDPSEEPPPSLLLHLLMNEFY